MKFLKMILISIVLLVSLSTYSQEIDKADVYYDYEIVPTGEISKDLDTVYTVVLVMNITDLQTYNSIYICI